eukprot:PhM_4_TR14272/c3_g2_i4/m.4884
MAVRTSLSMYLAPRTPRTPPSRNTVVGDLVWHIECVRRLSLPRTAELWAALSRHSATTTAERGGGTCNWGKPKVMGETFIERAASPAGNREAGVAFLEAR